jgi:DNA-binding transcriptional LysR family regulator
MNEIDLRRFDLNLLVVFEVLMVERNVTRAAERLGRTQSAISHSLSRLRRQLGDPLLIKGGDRMQPTAFALDLVEQARPMLRGIQRVLSPREIFDPSHSQRVFRLAAPDFMMGLFTELLARLRTEAPGVSIEWTTPREPTPPEVADGQVDLAIVPAEIRLPEGVTSEAVGALQWQCFGRKGHPAFTHWGPESWTKWRHLVVRIGDTLTSPVHLAAAAAGLERRIGGWVPHFWAVAPALAVSDLLATLPSLAMTETLSGYRLESRDVPFGIAPLPHAMIWRTNGSRDPGITWLRDRVRPIAKSKFSAFVN